MPEEFEHKCRHGKTKQDIPYKNRHFVFLGNGYVFKTVADDSQIRDHDEIRKEVRRI